MIWYIQFIYNNRANFIAERVTSTILNSEVSGLPVGRWSVPLTRGRRELPRLQSSTIRVLARYITAPPVSDVHH